MQIDLKTYLFCYNSCLCNQIDGIHKKAIESSSDSKVVIIDQTLLPHQLKYVTLKGLEDCIIAIKDMWVRGAPLIGVTASYGMFFAVKDNPTEVNIRDDIIYYVNIFIDNLNLERILSNIFKYKEGETKWRFNRVGK